MQKILYHGIELRYNDRIGSLRAIYPILPESLVIDKANKKLYIKKKRAKKFSVYDLSDVISYCLYRHINDANVYYEEFDEPVKIRDKK